MKKGGLTITMSNTTVELSNLAHGNILHIPILSLKRTDIFKKIFWDNTKDRLIFTVITLEQYYSHINPCRGNNIIFSILLKFKRS